LYGRESDDLVPEADAEDRHARQQRAHALDQVRHALGIARAVGQEHAVGLALEHRVGRGVGGDDSDVAARRPQLAQDVELDAGIERDHVKACGRRRAIAPGEIPLTGGPRERLLGGHLGHEVAADQSRQRECLLTQPAHVEIDG